MTRIFALRWLPLVLFLAGTVPGVVSAAVPATPGKDAQRAQTAALKKAAFARLRDLHAIELRNQYPARTRVSLYLDLQAKDFELQEISVRFDGRVLKNHKYTHTERGALKQGLNQRLVRTNLAPGKHKLVLAFSGIQHRLIRGDKPVTGGIALEFEKNDSTAEVLLVPLTDDAFATTQTLSPDDARVARGQEDPRLDNARYLRATGNKYGALIQLLEMAGPRNTSPVLPLAYDIELAQSYVDFGMRGIADEAMRTAFDTGVSLQVLADVWLRIAQLDYERGNNSRAYTLLQYLKPNLNAEQLVKWQDITSRLLMSEGQFDQAKDVLAQGDNALEVLTDASLATKQTPTMRFNYAITLLEGGETAKGRTLLERIGRVTDFDEAQRTLRDKANLQLGYNFLADEQGAAAKNILERIRINGPYSNEALLALGWSELAPHGTRQDRAAVGDEPDPGTYGTRDPAKGRIIKPGQPPSQSVDPFTRIQLGPFRQAKMADDEDEALRRALVAWKAVAGHSPQDAAVQEALIAIPYALESLNQHKRAANDYTHAIDVLEAARAELATYASAETIDLEAIRHADLSGLPDAPWMLQLLASYAFQEHYQNYVEFRRMHKDLQRLANYGSHNLSLRLSVSAQQAQAQSAQRLQKLIAALQAATEEQGKLAQADVAAEIKRQRVSLDKYIVSARLGLANFQAHAEEESPEAEDNQE